jgi:hypothetical protein
MSNLVSVLKHLEQERTRLTAQLENLKSAIAALDGNSQSSRRISAAGRARIAAAQRARWAKAKKGSKVRKAKVVTITRKRRKMSAAAIARIRAAQKARWATWRKNRTA